MMATAALNLFGGNDINMIAGVTRYLKASGLSIKELAERAGLTRSSLSKYLNNSYGANTVEIENSLNAYFSQQGIELFPDGTPAAKPAFFESRDVRGVLGVCSDCQEFAENGIITGKSGFGKSHTLRHFAAMPRVAYVECDVTMTCNNLVTAIERSLNIPRGDGAVWDRLNSLRYFFNLNSGWLLIIDEADKLADRQNIKKIEMLRSIGDQSNVGMIFAGEPVLKGIIEQITRARTRMAYEYELRGLSREEVAEYLAPLPCDEEALQILQERAMNRRFGCFRLLDRTLNNVLRIMRDGGQTSITAEMIAQASAMMLL